MDRPPHRLKPENRRGPVHAVRIDLLGRFRVIVGDRQVAEGDWPTRRSRELVALLALSNGQRVVRDHVIEALWPHLDAEAGAANLRKAAHHARRALADQRALVLREDRVELFPGREVEVDAARFLADAELALRHPDPDSCANVATGFGGELLPDSPYETWAQEPRRQLHARFCELLRAGRQWERLFDVDPTDEPACRELMREAVDAGRRHVAIRAYERLRIALGRELGIPPDAETRTLYERCITGARTGAAVFPACGVERAQAADRRHDELASRRPAAPTRVTSTTPSQPGAKGPLVRDQIAATVPRALAVTSTQSPARVCVAGTRAHHDQNLRIRQRSAARSPYHSNGSVTRELRVHVSAR
jgi:DNA-binding SARP family transcriptional activator